MNNLKSWKLASLFELYFYTTEEILLNEGLLKLSHSGQYLKADLEKKLKFLNETLFTLRNEIRDRHK